MLLLADLLHREGALGEAELAGYWPMARKAAAYIVRRGPSTQEERWEDERGFNAYTLGALIAALLVAAEMAETAGRVPRGRLPAGDGRRLVLEHRLLDLRRGQPAGPPRRRPRLLPAHRPARRPRGAGQARRPARSSRTSGPRIKEKYPPAAIVSPDALAYVRFGLRAPDDPRIVATAKVIDAITKVETPCGPAWHRYNHDGYGEKSDGSPFDGKHGYGRAWPLLTGERAHFELAAGRRDEAVRLMRAVERFAGDGGLIPEQVWDTYDIPEHDLYFGRPSGSAMPLAWAHAEYIKLRRSLRDGRVFDIPPQTVRRYLVDGVESPHVLWRPDHRRRAMPAGKVLRVEVPEPAVIPGAPAAGPTAGTSRPATRAWVSITPTCPPRGLPPGDAVRFTIVWTGSGWLTRKAVDAIKPSVVRIEKGVPHQGTEGRRRPVAAGAGADGAASVR